MADEKKNFNIFVTGGSQSAGLSTVKALLRKGHNVIASVTDADGALTVRRAGALPVYPNLTREGEILSVLKMAKVDVIVHAAPQVFGAIPQAEFDNGAHADWLTDTTNTVVKAASTHGVKCLVSVSFGYLQDADGAIYAPMKAAEKAVLDAGVAGYVVRAGYIYGGTTSATLNVADDIRNTRAVQSGTHTASWVHEDDLAGAIVALIEAQSSSESSAQIINVADDHPQSPNDFAKALGVSLGFQTVNFASKGFVMTRLFGKSFSDHLLAREVVLDTYNIKNEFGWQPQHADASSGCDATALQWRMSDATDPLEYYTQYEDKAADALAALKSGEALAAPVEEEVVKEKAAPVKAEAKATATTAPVADAGPAPWNEDEAKKEARRLKALERKKKRAQKSGG